MTIVHFCAGLEHWNGMANTARQFVAEELARGDDSQLTNDVRVVERMEKVDRIHIHGTWLPVLWKVAKLAKKKGMELIVRPCGNYDPIRIRRGTIKRLKKWLVGPFEHAMLNRANFVQCTCAAEVEWVKAYHPKARIQMTDLKRFFNLKEKGEGRKEKVGGLHLLYLGRRDPLKGVEFLEQAVAELSGEAVSRPLREEECSPLLRSGRETASPLIELRIISDHFGEELEKDWEWCDILCLPTLSENFGRVVAEALERGKRVITTDGAPVWEPEGEVAGGRWLVIGACKLGIGYDGRLIYLKGFRDGTAAERVALLKRAIVELAGK